jgi:phage FluMu protein Com
MTRVFKSSRGGSAMAGERGATGDARLVEDVRCDHCGESAFTVEGGELRCACGSLLGRWVAGGIELKCRRCKRTLVLAARGEKGEHAM